ncbi:MAG: hypothetical protein ACT4NY_23760 [Pseudonocardiales bacterium]
MIKRDHDGRLPRRSGLMVWACAVGQLGAHPLHVPAVVPAGGHVIGRDLAALHPSLQGAHIYTQRAGGLAGGDVRHRRNHDGGNVALTRARHDAAAHWHFARALELATEAGDAYQATYAMRHAAMMLVDRGEPDNGLKIVQFGLIKLGDLRPDDPRVEAQRGECHVVSVLALAGLGQGPGAHDELMVARDGWSPPTPHARGCMDLDAAHTYLLLGRLDMAQETAARASRTLAAAGERREGVLADLALARRARRTAGTARA